MINTQEILNNYIRRQNNERQKHEINSWQCSRLGSCLRGIYFERLGAKPDTEFDDRTLRVFAMGNMIEEFYVDRLEEEYGLELPLPEGEKPLLKVETQVRVEDEGLGVSGYADLVIEKDGVKEVLEIKSKNSRAFSYMVNKGEGAMRQHQYQIWTYLYLLGIERGKIIYLSKDDMRLVEFVVMRNDEQLKKEVFAELDLLNRAWKDKNPALLPLPEKRSWQEKYCRFHSHCLKVG